MVNEGLMCLINLMSLRTTQIELEGWLSSPQPLNSTGREVRAEGLRSRERIDFLLLGVCGCPRSQNSFGVGVLSSSMSSPA